MRWFPDSLGDFLSCLVALVVAFVVMVFSGIGCLFDTGSSCEFFATATHGILHEVGPPVLGPTFILIVGYLLIRHGFAIFGFLGRLVSGLFKAVIAVPLFILRALARVPAWLHYFFVPHPAEGPIREGRRQNTSQKIDLKTVARSMEGKASWEKIPPAYQSENQRRKAEKLRERLEEDERLFKSLEERERARRRVAQAKRGDG